ncbi:Xylose operon regulatory protein [Aquisphaera giovannonii]|uniref:Xylose operon regulatory protein n=1 Tax=Aquisphaera giovannonii TaxID=406548 RepID=A0A5B9VUZ8_9BACT|nr:DNA-binding transcriptional regulator [Aquisphaera giovannonii]QEH31939.1 Xylose operon regulatory protein [Aquisphaera giovannonii]
MHERPRVAVIVETSVVYGRQIHRGIARYVRSHRPWSMFLDQRELGAGPPTWLRRHRWDGIISRPTDRKLAAMFRAMRVPVVDLNDLHDDLGLPRVHSDDAAIGRLAAGHLLERGFRHFAFCGFTGERWSDGRREGCLAALAEAGCACDVHESYWRGPLARGWDREQDRIARWVAGLPRPLGIVACNDLRGHHVLDACARAGLAVPEEVAVIGVDDEELLCEMCDPPLSSVVPGAERIGHEAAELLDRLMAGDEDDRRSPELDRRIEPLGVVTRQSTDILAIPDADVAAALRLIRRRACEGLRVSDVLRRVPLSRSLLERRFRKFLGRSPQAEIRLVQVKRIKQLLAETDLPLAEVAALSGFEHVEYLSVVFKRLTGQSPGAYRRQVRS